MRTPSQPPLERSASGVLLAILAIGMFALAAGVVSAIVAATGPEPATPTQTVSQYVDKHGDIKRLCLAYKTGDHVDALSCNIIDDMNGELE